MIHEDLPEQLELLAFDHKPMRPPRQDVLGEVVFSEHWERLMAEEGPPMDDCDEYAFRSLMSAFPRKLTQRHATVAATFVNWLGTNCGAAFLSEARRMEQAGGGWGRGFVAAWAVQNMRQSSINWGCRTIEMLLAPDDHWNRSTFAGSGLLKLPELYADDYEVIEHVVRWLGNEGLRFLSTCEREITRRLAAEREERLHRLAAETGNDRLLAILNLGATR
jgi:hypothetical protein